MSEHLQHLLHEKRSADRVEEEIARARMNRAADEAARALRDALHATLQPFRGSQMRLGGENAIRAMGNALILTAERWKAMGVGHQRDMSLAIAHCVRELAHALDHARPTPCPAPAATPPVLQRAADDDL